MIQFPVLLSNVALSRRFAEASRIVRTAKSELVIAVKLRTHSVKNDEFFSRSLLDIECRFLFISLVSELLYPIEFKHVVIVRNLYHSPIVSKYKQRNVEHAAVVCSKTYEDLISTYG